MVRKHVRVRRGRRWARHTVASPLPWNERTDGCSNREEEGRASSWLLVARRRHGGVQAFSARDSYDDGGGGYDKRWNTHARTYGVQGGT